MRRTRGRANAAAAPTHPARRPLCPAKHHPRWRPSPHTSPLTRPLLLHKHHTRPPLPPPSRPAPLTRPLLLLKHHAALLVKHRVDAAHGLLRALDLHQVHRLQQAGLGGELGSVHGAARGGDDLTPPAVDGVGVQHHIADLGGGGEGECGGGAGEGSRRGGGRLASARQHPRARQPPAKQPASQASKQPASPPPPPPTPTHAHSKHTPRTRSRASPPPPHTHTKHTPRTRCRACSPPPARPPWWPTGRRPPQSP